jgi:hypothetical protein
LKVSGFRDIKVLKLREFVNTYFERFEFLPYVVTPAKAGVQKVLKRLDTGFRRYDDLPNFKFFHNQTSISFMLLLIS